MHMYESVKTGSDDVIFLGRPLDTRTERGVSPRKNFHRLSNRQVTTTKNTVKLLAGDVC